jgi:cell division FtsZ-interacting protein ZapD
VAQAPVEDSETKKIITDLTARLEKQEKTNQELQNTLLVTQSDVDAVKKENR